MMRPRIEHDHPLHQAARRDAAALLASAGRIAAELFTDNPVAIARIAAQMLVLAAKEQGLATGDISGALTAALGWNLRTLGPEAVDLLLPSLDELIRAEADFGRLQDRIKAMLAERRS